MKLFFLSIFPRYYEPFINESIISKAIEKKIVEIEVIDFRNYANNKHNKVDDEIYGGGSGMLLKVEPIDRALQLTKGKRILLSPQGVPFNASLAHELASEHNLTFIAGRYEGFDERVRSLIDLEISIGDYVLTGGELSSMVVADAIIRLVPGVISEDSHINDSFENNLLDYPQYTRPQSYNGMDVPDVLLNGHHEQIKKWRLEKQIEKTSKIRPDLLKKFNKVNK